MRTKLYNLFMNDVNFLDGKWYNLPILIDNTAIFDYNSEPDNYIQLRYDVANTSAKNGDGYFIERQSECDIFLITKGNFSTINNDMDFKIQDLLKRNKIMYNKFNLGYDALTQHTQATYSILLRT